MASARDANRCPSASSVVGEVGRLCDIAWTNGAPSPQEAGDEFSSAINVAKSVDNEQNMNINLIMFSSVGAEVAIVRLADAQACGNQAADRPDATV